MKTKILSYVASFAVFAAIAGFVFNALALGLFAVAVCALLLLITATDYRPAYDYLAEAPVAQPNAANAALPLAA